MRLFPFDTAPNSVIYVTVAIFSVRLGYTSLYNFTWEFTLALKFWFRPLECMMILA